MIESAELDRLLTQINCRITSIARLRDAGALGSRGPIKGIPKECRAYTMVCSRLAQAEPGDRSQQFSALAKTWLDLATQLEISEALLGACSIVSERKMEQEPRRNIMSKAYVMPVVAGAFLLGMATAALAVTGEYDNMCTMGLALGKEVKTDCSINETLDGKTIASAMRKPRPCS